MKYTLEKLKLLGLSYSRNLNQLELYDSKYGLIGTYSDYLKYPSQYPKIDSTKIGCMKINHPSYKCYDIENENATALNLSFNKKSQGFKCGYHIMKDDTHNTFHLKIIAPKIHSALMVSGGNSMFYSYSDENHKWEGTYICSDHGIDCLNFKYVKNDRIVETIIKSDVDGRVYVERKRLGMPISSSIYDSLSSALHDDMVFVSFFKKTVDFLNFHWIQEESIVNKMFNEIQLHDTLKSCLGNVLFEEKEYQKKIG